MLFVDLAARLSRKASKELVNVVRDALSGVEQTGGQRA